MSMYDEVVFECPVCKERVAQRTDQGDCTFRDIPSKEVPQKIADALVGQRATCSECTLTFEIVSVTRTVCLTLR